MPINRTTIVRGPCMVAWNSLQFWSKGDVQLSIPLKVFEVMTSAYGKVGEALADRIATVHLEPAGEITAAFKAALWPYASFAIGASIFGATDLPLILYALDGTSYTFAAAALTKMPDIIQSAKKTAVGPLEFTCIGKDNTAWSTANSFLQVASLALPSIAFTPANVLYGAVSAAWGASPFDAFVCKDGFTTSFNLEIEPFDLDSDGTIDFWLKKLDVTTRAQPVTNVTVPGATVAITAAAALARLPLAGAAGGLRGSLLTNASDLVMTQTGGTAPIVLTTKKAVLKEVRLDYGSGVPRLGEMVWEGTRDFTGAVANPIFAIA